MNKKETEKKERLKVLQTHDGHRLSPREDLFITKYLELGTARQAYLQAGYAEKFADQKANILLNKEYIKQEIRHRRNERYKENAATAEEVMDFFAKVMRGEVKDQFGLEAPLSERTKAATEIAKRTIDIDNRIAGKENNASAEVKITLDWARPEPEENTEVTNK